MQQKYFQGTKMVNSNETLIIEISHFKFLHLPMTITFKVHSNSLSTIVHECKLVFSYIVKINNSLYEHLKLLIL